MYITIGTYSKNRLSWKEKLGLLAIAAGITGGTGYLIKKFNDFLKLSPPASPKKLDLNQVRKGVQNMEAEYKWYKEHPEQVDDQELLDLMEQELSTARDILKRLENGEDIYIQDGREVKV